MAKVLRRLGAPPSLTTMEVVFTRWVEVVGSELAAHAQPVRVRGNILVIGADHPAWVTRCRMENEHIIAAARAMGDTTVERIEVVLQRPREG
jgi:predicted nucleic acid-binding Zn ribbon protein